MADWSLRGDGQRFKDYGTTLASSRGTTITAGAANTKGSYSQIVASTDYTGMLYVSLFQTSTDADFLIDIAIGAAASEQIIVEDIYLYGRLADFWGPLSIFFPIQIASGTRIALRCQSNVAAATIDATVEIIGVGIRQGTPLSKVDAYGENTSLSRGTSVSISAANTKGSYSELVASCNRVEEICISFGKDGSTTSVTQSWLVDIAIGAAGSEQIIIPNFPVVMVYSVINPIMIGPIPVSIPAGTRIAARAQSSGTTLTSFDMVLYGIR